MKKENRQAFHEAYLLITRPNGKELDLKFFDEKEKKAFDESDSKEWTSWIDNKVVRRLNDEEVRQMDPRDVFRAPARIVRVNKLPCRWTPSQVQICRARPPKSASWIIQA